MLSLRFTFLVAVLLAVSSAEAVEPTAQEAARRHWAFQPLQKIDPPTPTDAKRVRTQVDRFLLAKLEAAKLTFAPDADKTTLIRRASLDLLGLPPTPEEVTAFVADTSAEAYEKLLDRLHASPHFGERWGRHWLDGAGYVDVTGGDNDAATVKLGENKFLYRDYVIRSFNDDKPFNKFLLEQIAGDELVNWREAATFTPDIRDSLIATGFLRTAADDTDENELNTLDIRHGILQRTGEVLANNLLGLTLNCAKCHDHKYEPLPQEDYFRFLSMLQPALNPDNWIQPKQRLFPAISPAEKAAIEKENAALDKQIAELMTKKLDPAAFSKQLAELKAKRRSWENWHVVYDVGEPTPTHILKRGNHKALGDAVTPGFLRVLCANAKATNFPAAAEKAASSGRRLALARWLTDENSAAGALVLRVRVNRIWHQMFGRGLVESVDNFGLTGTKPTHPELLDWLAGEFVRNGQQLKPFLKTLMTSTAYRQSSRWTDAAPTADPDNKLLWRMRLRRLESEIVRDSILAVSGKLDRTLGGAPVPVESRVDGSFVPRDGEKPRRSVYLLARRNYHPTLLGAFDQPNLTTNCTARQASAVVLQPLAMLNDEFVRTQAAGVAERVAKNTKPGEEVIAAFQIVLCRKPTKDETAICEKLLAEQRENYAKTLPADRASRQALAHLCHVLLNTSEFLYVP